MKLCLCTSGSKLTLLNFSNTVHHLKSKPKTQNDGVIQFYAFPSDAFDMVYIPQNTYNKSTV